MSLPISAFNRAEDLTNFATESLRGHLHRKGKVFYSGFETYRRASVIFLGYNPGGAGDELLAVRAKQIKEGFSNDYVDETWGDGRPNTLQTRARELFDALGFDLRKDVFTSNLYFQNTRSIADTNTDDFKAFRPVCWPITNHILAAVPARVVICNGNKTFYDLLYWLDPEHANQPGFYDANDIYRFGKRGRVMSVQRTIHGRQFLIVGLPHLSWVAVAKKTEAVTPLKIIITNHLAEKAGAGDGATR